jgi:hypothetical protein
MELVISDGEDTLGGRKKILIPKKEENGMFEDL